MDLAVIREDNHLLAVAKPAGLLSQGDRSGDVSLLDVAREYLRVKYDKPGNVYVGLVHRLDRNVSGVVLLARTSKAASRLSDQFRQGIVRKTYLAIVTGQLPQATGELRSWLSASGDHRGVTRAESVSFDGSKESLLRYHVLESRGDRSLLEVCPVTGRRHQIRAQLAQAGCPLQGDIKYGAGERLPARRIALHALRLEVRHPVGGDELVLQVDPPDDWPWPVRQGPSG